MVGLKNKEGFTRNIFTLVIIVFLSLFSFMVLDQIKTGIGFGKDIRLVVRTNQQDALEDFMQASLREGVEMRKEVIIEDDVYLLTSSYDGSLSTHEKQMRDTVTDLEIIQSGSFGSITKLKNYQSFVAVYIFVYISLIVIYFTSRFKLLGLYTGLEIVLMIMMALSMVTFFNYPLTKSLWYAFLVGSIILISQKRAQLVRNQGKSLASVYKHLPKFTPQCLLHSFIFLLMGFITAHQAPYDFPSVSIFYFALSVFNFLGEVILNRLGPFILMYLGKEDGKPAIMFENHPLIKVNKNLTHKYKWARNIFVSLFILSIILGVIYGFNYQEGEDFSNMNVVVIKKADPSTFLQVEAILHKMEYFDDQLAYEVSEQGHIWLNFEAHLTERELIHISNSIQKEAYIEAGYFKTHSATPPLLSRVFYTRAFFMVLLSIVIQYVFRKEEHFIAYAATTVLSFIFFIFLVIIYQLKWTREIVVAAWFVPLITSVIATAEPRLLTSEHEEGTVQAAIHSLTAISLVTVPVLIIVPTRIGIEIAFILILVFLAIHFAFCFVAAGKKKSKEILYEDELSSSDL